METYKIKTSGFSRRGTVKEKHLIIEDNENVILIDTGSPITVHVTNEFEFLGEKHNVTSNYMGIDIAKLSTRIGRKITTLLGTDILSKFSVIFDCQKSRIHFDHLPETTQTDGLPIELFSEIPIVNFKIEGMPLKAFLDTGAQISYLREDVTSKYEKSGVSNDFHPTIGSFVTNTFDIKTELNNNKFDVKYGNLPLSIKPLLEIANVDAILGYDFLKNFVVRLNLRDRRMIAVNYEVDKFFFDQKIKMFFEQISLPVKFESIIRNIIEIVGKSRDKTDENWSIKKLGIENDHIIHRLTSWQLAFAMAREEYNVSREDHISEAGHYLDIWEKFAQPKTTYKS